MEIIKTYPTVSVVLSTYNGLSYLREALDSVLNQTFQDLEFLVIDDVSSDGSYELLLELATLDPRLKIRRNDRNRGVGYNYSELLDWASGKYIAQIGQDDRWDSEFLTTVVDYLDEHPTCAVVFADVRVIGADGESREAASPFRFDWLKDRDATALLYILFRHNFVCAGSSLFRKSDLSGWRTLGDNDQLQDWNTWLHFVTKGNFVLLPNKLHNYRVHGQNMSLSNVSTGLVRLEFLHTRTQIINSAQFWNFMAALENREAALEGFFSTYADVYQKDPELGFGFLLYAMRSVEHLFRDSRAFNEWLGLLFWREGAFLKANRYWLSGGPQGLPAFALKGIGWKPFLILSKRTWSPSPLHWIRFLQFGPIVIGVVKTLKKPGFLGSVWPFLRLDASSRTIERSLEFINANSPSFLQKMSLLLRGNSA